MKTEDTSSLCQTSKTGKYTEDFLFFCLPLPELGKRLALFSKSADTPESLSAEMEVAPQDTFPLSSGTEERQWLLCTARLEQRPEV